MLRPLFSRRWLFTTLLVIAAVLVMARLGIWQLDRLESRRAYNARVLAQLEEPRLELNAEALDLDLYEMEYRHVRATGRYLPEEEIVLRNQSWQGRLGVQLFTPLLIQGTNRAILVQRGWIPADQADADGRAAFREEGMVSVEGLLRRAETDFGLRLIPDPTLSPGQERLDAWNNLDLDRIAAQMEVQLLPVYLLRQPEQVESEPPIAEPISLDLSEGPHLGYAGQWFLFAAVLGLGYPFFVKRQEEAAAVK